MDILSYVVEYRIKSINTKKSLLGKKNSRKRTSVLISKAKRDYYLFSASELGLYGK